MIWFFGFQLIGLILLLLGVLSYARYRGTPFILVFHRNFRKLFLLWLVVVIAITLATSKYLYRTGQCAIAGHIREADTKFSWWEYQCFIQYPGRHGWTPIELSRGVPGKDDLEDIDNPDLFEESID